MTKIESASNRYTFVWRKSVEKNKLRLEAKVGNIIKQIKKGIQDDNRADDPTPTPINSKVLKEKIKELNANEKQSREEKKQVRELVRHQAKLEETSTKATWILLVTETATQKRIPMQRS